MKWRKDMSQSQRRRYNRYQRLQHLQRQLKEGRLPIPRYVPDAKLLALYKRYDAEYGTTLPIGELAKDQELWELAKKQERAYLQKCREHLRNRFPADYPAHEFRAFWKKVRPVFYRQALRDMETLTGLTAKH